MYPNFSMFVSFYFAIDLLLDYMGAINGIILFGTVSGCF
jgi:hypothetical protein